MHYKTLNIPLKILKDSLYQNLRFEINIDVSKLYFLDCDDLPPANRKSYPVRFIRLRILNVLPPPPSTFSG